MAIMKVRVRKWGNSQGVILPKHVLSAIGVDKVDVDLNLEVTQNKKIVMEKAKKPITIDDLFKDFDYKSYWENWEKEHPNESKEVNFGKPVGKEFI